MQSGNVSNVIIYFWAAVQVMNITCLCKLLQLSSDNDKEENLTQVA